MDTEDRAAAGQNAGLGQKTLPPRERQKSEKESLDSAPPAAAQVQVVKVQGRDHVSSAEATSAPEPCDKELGHSSDPDPVDSSSEAESEYWSPEKEALEKIAVE